MLIYFHIIKPISKSHPNRLVNNSTDCYMNSIIQYIASNNKLIEQFKIIESTHPNVESLNCFIELFQSEYKYKVNVNKSDDSHKHLFNNPDLLERLMRSVNWTKPFQHDAFELLSALVNGIHQDLENYEMPITLKIVHQFKGIKIPNKLQHHISLSLRLCGDYSTKPGVTIEHLIDECFQPSIIDDDPNKTFQIFLYRKAPYVLLLHIQTNKWDNIRGEMIKPEYHIQYNKIKAIVQHMGYIGGGYCVT